MIRSRRRGARARARRAGRAFAPEQAPTLDRLLALLATVAPDLVARAMQAPHPMKAAEPRVCWLGGVPRCSHGLLQVSAEGGEMYATLAPRAVADGLARCHPAGSGRATPPRLGELASADGADGADGADWIAALRPRGLVLVEPALTAATG